VNTTSRYRKYGFSLAEVIIAIFLIALGAVMLGAMFPMASKTGKMVGNHEQAASIVQHKIDQLRGVGYGRLTFSELYDAGIIDNKSTQPYEFTQADELAKIYPDPKGTIEITTFSSNIKKVNVVLEWTGSAYNQGNGRITATALIAKN